MKKKRLLSSLLAGAVAFSLVACNSSASTDASKSSENVNSATASSTTSATSSVVAEETPVEGGQLIIGDTTQSNGDVYPYWTNNASDRTVYSLTFGYGTIAIDKLGKYITNPMVVEKMDEVDNSDGSKTVTFKLVDDLKWSNGEKITAKDYVFSILFFSNPALLEYGANDVTYGLFYVGFDDYSGGKTDVFEGVRLLSDTEFSVTVDKKNLPYFYERAMFSIGPSYTKGWLPEGYDVLDDGKGAYIKGDLKKESVKKHVNDYRMDLKVYSGPYMVEKYDETSNTYTLKKNPEYKGDFQGNKPHIETLVYKLVKPETMMDELQTGNVEFLFDLKTGDEINSGMDIVEKGGHGFVDYPRNGYGQLTFICDRGPTQFVEVRHAVAYLLNRNEFAKTFTGGYGGVVNAEYGTGMWQYEAREEELAALNPYSYSFDNAVSELEKGGWVLDKDGKPYESGIRYKKLESGELMPLVIEWCSSENNPVSDLLSTMLANNPDVKKAGMEIKQTTVTFNELINNYYQQKENNFNMYNLGTGFTAIFDRQKDYELNNPRNLNRIDDPELDKLAKDMVKVDPDDEDLYLDKWVAFEKRYNEMLPNLPLYSNQIYDFFSDKLHNYTGIRAVTWEFDSQINYSWVSDK